MIPNLKALDFRKPDCEHVDFSYAGKLAATTSNEAGLCELDTVEEDGDIKNTAPLLINLSLHYSTLKLGKLARQLLQHPLIEQQKLIPN